MKIETNKMSSFRRTRNLFIYAAWLEIVLAGGNEKFEGVLRIVYVFEFFFM